MMSASGRCTYLLFVTAVLALGILPHSWFGYPWHASPVRPAFIVVCWGPLVAWAVLADFRFATRTGILACPSVAAISNGGLTGRIEIAIAVILIVGPARFVGIRLKCMTESSHISYSRGQYSLTDLLMVVGGLAAALKATEFLWHDNYVWFGYSHYWYRRFDDMYWTRFGSYEFTLMTSVWLVSLGIVVVGDGKWRLAALVPMAGVLMNLFYGEKLVIREYFKVVSWEHPTIMAIEFLGTQVLYATVSLLSIRWCGFRLCWERSVVKRRLTGDMQSNPPDLAEDEGSADPAIAS